MVVYVSVCLCGVVDVPRVRPALRLQAQAGGAGAFGRPRHLCLTRVPCVYERGPLSQGITLPAQLPAFQSTIVVSAPPSVHSGLTSEHREQKWEGKKTRLFVFH